MKLAVIAVTQRGATLAQHVAAQLTERQHSVQVFAKEGRSTQPGQQAFSSLGDITAQLFAQYDGLIFIMAAGIVVRVIAPFLQHKSQDPAVVVMDDHGQHAISLLSGHLGGANELTQQVAACSGACPVITTATDVAGKTAADMLAVKLNLTIESFHVLKTINAALVHDETVDFFIDEQLPQLETLRQKARTGFQVELQPIKITPAFTDQAKQVLITDRLQPTIAKTLLLRPRTLSVGVGCRRGTPGTAIIAAIEDACRSIERSPLSIASINSIVLKQDEPGLLEAIAHYHAVSRFYTAPQLQQCIDEQQLTISNFVKQEIGVGNVCEAAAMLAGQTNRLLLTKTRYPNITIAIALVSSK